jgi:hypothetical protein
MVVFDELLQQQEQHHHQNKQLHYYVYYQRRVVAEQQQHHRWWQMNIVNICPYLLGDQTQDQQHHRLHSSTYYIFSISYSRLCSCCSVTTLGGGGVGWSFMIASISTIILYYVELLQEIYVENPA